MTTVTATTNSSDVKWKADIINNDGTSQSYTSDNYSESEFNEVKDKLDTVLLDKIALLERKLELCKAQRNEYVFVHVDLKNGNPMEVIEKMEEDLNELRSSEETREPQSRELK